MRAIRRLDAAADSGAWDEYRGACTRPMSAVESRRKIVGFARLDLPIRRMANRRQDVLARSALCATATWLSPCAVSAWLLPDWRSAAADMSPGAPQDEVLQLFGLDDRGPNRACGFGSTSKTSTPRSPSSTPRTPDPRSTPSRAPLENAASRADHQFNALFAERRWDEVAAHVGRRRTGRRPSARTPARDQLRPRHGDRGYTGDRRRSG